MARETEYLTVQDHLWINLQVAGKSNKWRFAALEQAVYNQYGYGKSLDIIGQAARYLTSFARNNPFDSANHATAFVGLLVFLGLNGYAHLIKDSEGAALYEELIRDPEGATRRLKALTRHSGDDGDHASVESLGKQVLAEYPKTIAALVDRSESPSAA